MSDFNNLKPDNSFYWVGDNILKKQEKEENYSQDLEQDITTFDDLVGELLDLPEEELLRINSGNIEISRQSKRVWTPPILYPIQFSYNFAPISKRLLDNPI